MKVTWKDEKKKKTRNTIHTDSLVLPIPYCPIFTTRHELHRAELYTLHPPEWREEECSV